MELEELKNLWQAEDRSLDKRIQLIEAHLIKMDMESANNEITKIVKLSVFGRNMALVYCLISIGMAMSIINLLEYSIPAILGALAMLWSFISHLSIIKPNFNDPILQLQKSICNFRIHLAANAKYDILIVVFWFLTLAPIFLKITFKISLYDDSRTFAIFCLIAGFTLTVLVNFSNKAYREYDKLLNNAQDYLLKLTQFEKGTE
jgi:hypothetical protein